jgi:hypothetical protein
VLSSSLQRSLCYDILYYDITIGPARHQTGIAILLCSGLHLAFAAAALESHLWALARSSSLRTRPFAARECACRWDMLLFLLLLLHAVRLFVTLFLPVATPYIYTTCSALQRVLSFSTATPLMRVQRSTAILHACAMSKDPPLPPLLQLMLRFVLLPSQSESTHTVQHPCSVSRGSKGAKACCC